MFDAPERLFGFVNSGSGVQSKRERGDPSLGKVAGRFWAGTKTGTPHIDLLGASDPVSVTRHSVGFTGGGDRNRTDE